MDEVCAFQGERFRSLPRRQERDGTDGKKMLTHVATLSLFQVINDSAPMQTASTRLPKGRRERRRSGWRDTAVGGRGALVRASVGAVSSTHLDVYMRQSWHF